MCGPITSRYQTTDLGAESAFADYLIATARSDPVKFIDVSRCVLFDTPFVGSLLSNYLEDSVRRHQKAGNQSLNRNLMLPLICAAEKAGHVVVSLYSLEDGYSISLRHKDGKWVESVRIPYNHSDIILSVDEGMFPPELSDVLQSVVPPVLRNGHLVVELRDYRPPILSSELPYDRSFHLLSSSPLATKQPSTSNAVQPGTEKRLIDAICCDPRPAVFLVRAAYARNSKQIYSHKLAGVLKKQFKSSLRKLRFPTESSSRSLFSVFNPCIPSKCIDKFSMANQQTDSPNLLSNIIESYPLRSPSDDFFIPHTHYGLVTSPSSFMDLLVDELVLKQMYLSVTGSNANQQPPVFLERYIRIRIYISERTDVYSAHLDFAATLAKALSMNEEHASVGNPQLGTQGDVLAYLKQFVSLLVVEGGGKVEVVHYKQINRQHTLALDRRGFRAFEPGASSFSASNNRTIANQRVVQKPEVRDVQTSITPPEEGAPFVEEPRPSSGMALEFSADRHAAPRTPSSQISSYTSLIAGTGLTPNLIVDHHACEGVSNE